MRNSECGIKSRPPLCLTRRLTGTGVSIPDSEYRTPHFRLSDFTIVDDPGHFRPQVAAVDDPVHKPVLEQEFAGLEALREFEPDGVLDRPCPGEPDHGL